MEENWGSYFRSKSMHWRQMGVPVSGTFELTPRCNFDCKMCYVHLTPEQMGDRRELSTEQWIRIIDEAIEHGMLFALLTGGECMLHPGFRRIYTHLKDYGILITVNTNGLLLTDENIAFFRENPPSKLRLTLYGASEDTYERTTGRRVYGRVIRNIDKLNAAGIRPVVAMSVSKYCYDDVIPMIRIIRGYGLKYTMDMNMIDGDEGTGHRAEDYALSPEQIARKYAEIRQLSGQPLYENEPVTEIPPLMPDNPESRGMHCGAGRTTYVVRWDGTMVPCFMMDEVGVNAAELGFAAAWAHTARVTKEYPMPVECFSCRFNAVCPSCIMLRQDKKNPGHRNPRACLETIAKYNAGVIALKDEAPSDAEPSEDCQPELS